MEKITSTAELQHAILLLEAEQGANALALKEQFANINPLNLIKGTLKKEVASPVILDDLIISGVGLATGYLTRKIFVGSSANVLRKLMGSALQMSATSVVAKNSKTIKSVGHLLFNMYLSKKKRTSCE